MLTVDQIAKEINTTSVVIRNGELIIEHLSIDTRTMVFPQETLFFAFQGSRKQGVEFISQSYKNGCRAYVVPVSDEPKIKTLGLEEASLFFVENVLVTLQEIAQLHRRKFKLETIGITGSNGKTWVKDWLFECLKGQHNIVRSPGSYNSQIGVALSVWNLTADHDLGIFEAGISTVDEMTSIAKIIQPGIGIFTMLGDAHKTGFNSDEEKLEEKLLLFENCHTIIYDKDDTQVDAAIQKKYGDKNLVSISKVDEEANFYIEEIISAIPHQTEIKYRCQLETTSVVIQDSFIIHFDDQPSIHNVALVAATVLALSHSPMLLSNEMPRLSPMEMRLQIVDGIHGSTLINDGYSLDLNSFRWALIKLNIVGEQGYKTVIVSDILQQGEMAIRQMAEEIKANEIDQVIGIGNEIQKLGQWLPDAIGQTYCPDTNAGLAFLQKQNFNNQTILLKGSRVFEFEKIAAFLTATQHTVRLHVDFDAMLHNLQFFGRRINPGTKVMSVIKASAYGSGSLEIARFLSFFKIDYFAVAVIDEGIKLRKGGIKTPILILNPDANTFDEIYQWDLEPEVYSFSVLKKCIASANVMERKLPVHLKMNTGMNRLGFDPDMLGELRQILEKHSEGIEVKSIFSHLTSSNDPAEDAFTRKQMAQFEEMYEALTHQAVSKPWRHILNTNGILRFPDHQYEMVRMGMGLYGVGMGPFNQYLKPAHSLSARIIQVRWIAEGDIVGYGNSFVATERMRIATVNIGYADGIPRNAGNAAHECLIFGKPAPIIGRVCMDVLMCDVSHIPEADEGTEVWIFNAEKSIEELSRATATIPYEILSKMSVRVKRVFHYL